MCRKKEAEFVLRYVDIDEAIRVNSEYKSDDFFDEIMIKSLFYLNISIVRSASDTYRL